MLKYLPTDIILIGGLSTIAPLLYHVSPGTNVRVVFAAFVLFFAPGYMAMCILFPRERGDELNTTPAPIGFSRSPIGLTQRLASSIGLSIIALPLFGVVIWGIGLDIIRFGSILITGFILLLALGAVIVRYRTPAPVRYNPNPFSTLSTVRSDIQRRPAPERLLMVVLLLAIVLAVGTLAVGFTMPQAGESFTEFGVGTTDDEGDFVFSGYSTELIPGEEESYRLLIGNYEGESTEYMVVIELQRMEDGSIVEREELDSVHVSVDVGEQHVLTRTIRPNLQGDDVRLAFQLYIDSDESEYLDRSPDRTLHLQVDVSDIF